MQHVSVDMETRLPPSSDEEDQLALFIPKLSEPCTACFSLFVRRHWQIFDFLFFCIQLGRRARQKKNSCCKSAGRRRIGGIQEAS
jgi:hypothetical protein